jgi:hypothetical protein
MSFYFVRILIFVSLFLSFRGFCTDSEWYLWGFFLSIQVHALSVSPSDDEAILTKGWSSTGNSKDRKTRSGPLSMKTMLEIDSSGKAVSMKLKIVLIVVDVKAGNGRGEQVWQTIVRPTLEKKKISYEFFRSKRPRHASFHIEREIVSLSRIDAIIVVGDDRTLHDVVDGLLKRDDVLTTDELPPIGVVPSVRGNKDAIGVQWIDPQDAIDTILDDTKNCIVTVDAVKFEHGPWGQEEVRYSFRLMSCGLRVHGYDSSKSSVGWLQNGLTLVFSSKS